MRDWTRRFECRILRCFGRFGILCKRHKSSLSAQNGLVNAVCSKKTPTDTLIILAVRQIHPVENTVCYKGI
ncbi:MAG TPA: hypothetical protein PKW18_11925 [Candidatus Sumerlaeota bacterium]|nr:hypothetical protein [Candidatus Sumerlaeota bacterium]